MPKKFSFFNSDVLGFHINLFKFAHMKKFSCILMTAVLCLPLQAQRVGRGPLHSPDDPREEWILPGDTLFVNGDSTVYGGKPMKMDGRVSAPLSAVAQVGERSSALETVHPGSSAATIPVPESIQTYGWGLHRGLNVSVGLSAFATFGKYAPHRGGFAQTISAAYLSPLTKDGKLWLAGGGYFNNTFWGSDSYRDVGLYAMLGYRFNDHWEAYAYGQLSLADNYGHYYYDRPGCYGYGRYGYGCSPVAAYWPGGMGLMGIGGMGVPGANVVGAGVIYHVNKSFSLGLNVEGVWYNDNHTPRYFGQYDYPVPQP